MNTNKSFSGFWYDKNNSGVLPDIVTCSIKSFLINNFEYNLYTYQKFSNIPTGCIVKDANEIINFNDFFIHKSGSIAPFSDYFRIKLLSKYDTIWTDTDNFFIKDIFDGGYMTIIQQNRILNGLLLFDESDEYEIKQCLEAFFENPLLYQKYDSEKLRKYKRNGKIEQLRHSDNYRRYLEWNIAGSELYTSIFNYLGIKEKSYDYYRYFNPYHFSKQSELYTKDIFLIDMNKFNDVGIFVLSTDLLRRDPNILKNYNRNSFVYRLLSKINEIYENNNPIQGDILTMLKQEL